MRSILLHIDDDECLTARIQVALDLAREFGGHLTCVQAVPYVFGMPGDLYGTMAAQMLPEFQKAADELRARLEADLANEGVGWTWIQGDGPAIERLLDVSGLADVAVIGCCDPLSNDPSPLPGELAIRARTPVMAVPKTAASLDTRGPALVAWDGSPESCRALRAAVPLLARSRAVTLASVEEKSGRARDLPPTEGGEYLSRHGIACELVALPANGQPIAEVLANAASVRKAAYVVMGAYGHSRLAETVLGGVTRGLFKRPPLPILACH